MIFVPPRGWYGSVLITNTDAVTGVFSHIEVLADTTFTTLTGSMTAQHGDLPTFSARTRLSGRFTESKLAAGGAVMAYNSGGAGVNSFRGGPGGPVMTRELIELGRAAGLQEGDLYGVLQTKYREYGPDGWQAPAREFLEKRARVWVEHRAAQEAAARGDLIAEAAARARALEEDEG